MGEPVDTRDERIGLLMAYQVTTTLLEMTGNLHVKFMHFLPAFHHRQTDGAETLQARTGPSEHEVAEEVLKSHHSVVFDQAGNRSHTIKAVMVATLGTPGAT